MGYKTKNYAFSRYNEITGWDEVREFKIEVKNTRGIPVKVEIKRNFNTKKWRIENRGEYGSYEKIDADTVKYTLNLTEKTKEAFSYILTTYHGSNADNI